jgi:hypothetical protein
MKPTENTNTVHAPTRWRSLWNGFCGLGAGFASIGEGLASALGGPADTEYYLKSSRERINRDLVGYGLRPLADTSNMTVAEALASDRAAIAGDFAAVRGDFRKARAQVAAEYGVAESALDEAVPFERIFDDMTAILEDILPPYQQPPSKQNSAR